MKWREKSMEAEIDVILKAGENPYEVFRRRDIERDARKQRRRINKRIEKTKEKIANQLMIEDQEYCRRQVESEVGVSHLIDPLSDEDADLLSHLTS